MPSVKKNESKEKYLSRCIPVLIKEGKPQNQAVAICNSMYEQSKKKKESKGDNSDPKWEDNEKNGFLILPPT